MLNLFLKKTLHIGHGDILGINYPGLMLQNIKIQTDHHKSIVRDTKNLFSIILIENKKALSISGSIFGILS